jgi:hypothetical protein
MRLMNNAAPQAFEAGQFAVNKKGKIWEGLIFRAGSYPDKGMEVDESDIAQLARTMGRVSISLGHPQADSPLDGQLGWLVAAEARGTELWGQIEFPSWMESLLPDQVSISLWLTFSPIRIVDLSLVNHPRINGAAIQRAYAAFSAGQNPPRKEPAMEGPTTNFWEQFSQFLMGQKQGGTPPQAPQPPVPAHAPTPQADPQFAAMQSELATYRQTAFNARKSEIAQFSQGLIDKGRIDPAQKADIESALLSAAEADQSEVKFSAKPEGGLFEQLKKIFTSLPEDPKGLLKSGFKIVPGQTQSTEEDVEAAFAVARGEKK